MANSIHEQFHRGHVTMGLDSKVGRIKNSNENLVSLRTCFYDVNGRDGRRWEKDGSEGKGEEAKFISEKNFLNVNSDTNVAARRKNEFRANV